jgi:2-polyprenyl-6-methoxyphenol hydroxylase-like FAD-dependent oxidoreductase
VLVVGGGIGGMTAALALAQQGVACTVVELEAEPRTTGVGIGLQSPPLRALKSLGLFDEVVRIGRPQPVIELQRADGSPIATIPQVNVNGPDDPPFVNMSRAALHDLLAAAVRDHGIEVRYGTTASSLADAADGVVAALTDGTEERFDLVVGADGLHSATRRQVLPDAPAPAYAGQVIWRMAGRCPDGLEAYTIMDGGRHRIGLVPLPGDELYLWMLDSTLPPERPADDVLLDLFLERMAAYGGHAPAVAAQAVSAAQLDYRALSALLVPPPWHRGRTVLIGDAVHTTTPHLAWGAGLAIEDAVVLGELVGAGVDPAEIGPRLAARRFERCRIVVEGSLQLSRWEQEGRGPRPEAAALTADAFAALAAPI